MLWLSWFFIYVFITGPLIPVVEALYMCAGLRFKHDSLLAYFLLGDDYKMSYIHGAWSSKVFGVLFDG